MNNTSRSRRADYVPRIIQCLAGIAAGGLVSHTSFGADTTSAAAETDAASSSALNRSEVENERLALFEAERDAVLGGSELSPQGVAARRADFWAQNLERIVRQREQERLLQKEAIKRVREAKAAVNMLPAEAGRRSVAAKVIKQLSNLDVIAELEAKKGGAK